MRQRRAENAVAGALKEVASFHRFDLININKPGRIQDRMTERFQRAIRRFLLQ
jgi:hypothetical protein